MSQYDQDPFAKYDKLFEEQDKKNIVKPATQTKKEHQTEKPTSGLNDAQKQKAIRIIITVFFVILILQFLPVIMMRGGLNVTPVFSIIFTIVIINIIIKAFKR
ncbi:MAG: hypothetical protein A2Y45_10230 [Tenericutes bacterium GWC2_34_14]|nr:MAG: hypothetical protein A2Z84_04565 [Tenericutes bacterium GWA2_35_7]OHE28950.1 MAG: hypothetical protein A2Y45_10230 [Tenericutes bacterium GWC2_34_14]OHE33839.1 MAG: hypothetical protein A2012_06980 [Tenericutes bacterium GWE2_34_108]OHE36574.1 MAG: hypothetical protein A2Y46_03790 [Tenericutes bacterium GWF1_35_14]OHE37850.1 MAG: hypothetical protein A2Y44_05490 [Tenericutes bacterium GWF2_35_184]OHE45305.1 MAG: hypothetical protein A2221_07855 [Tenericutes bacterium RIFOXYA2_FULL_36_3